MLLICTTTAASASDTNGRLDERAETEGEAVELLILFIFFFFFLRSSFLMFNLQAARDRGLLMKKIRRIKNT